MMLERFLPLLAAAVIAIAVTVLSTGGVPSPFTSGAGGTTAVEAGTAGGASAPTPPTSGEAAEAALRVHALLPASLRPGGTRQLLLQLSGPALLTVDADDLLEITFTLEEPRAGVWVRPEQHVLRRGSLQRTRFTIGLHADVACDAELGDLHVAVRDLTEDGAAGETTVAMPPVNCTEPPPSSQETVHITDPVCGENWREELEALKEGDELDPERCAEERWGHEPGSEPGPPPARAAPRTSAPEQEAPEEPEESPTEEPEEPAEEPEQPAEEPEEPPAETTEEAPEETASEEPAEEAETPTEDGSTEEASEEGSSNEAPEGATEEAVGESEGPEEAPSEE